MSEGEGVGGGILGGLRGLHGTQLRMGAARHSVGTPLRPARCVFPLYSLRGSRFGQVRPGPAPRGEILAECSSTLYSAGIPRVYSAGIPRVFRGYSAGIPRVFRGYIPRVFRGEFLCYPWLGIGPGRTLTAAIPG